MAPRRTLLPPHGNPTRPVMLHLAATFGLMLIGFPAIMLGESIAGAVGVAVFIAVVAGVCLGILWGFAEEYESDRASLLADEAWAEWTLSTDEHRTFLADERRRSRNLAATLGFGGSAVGLVIAGFGGNPLFGGITVVVFLCMGLVVLIATRLPPSAGGDAGREVVVGWRGALVLGRYLPFDAARRELARVELRYGYPAVLLFHVLVEHRPHQLRVSVPNDRMAEAEALMERFRDTGGVPIERSYPSM